eukprot:428906_1
MHWCLMYPATSNCWCFELGSIDCISFSFDYCILEQNMMKMLLIFYFFQLALCTDQPYNILFIVSDDLRADLGKWYGQQDIIYTPNIDAFQDKGFTFTHAYSQQAVCGPTRASFLTGVRPDTTRIWNIGPYFRDRMINGSGQTVITLPQYFREYGDYYTIGAGKIFHPGTSSGGDNSGCNFGNDMPFSWSEPYWDCDESCDWMESPAQNQCANNIGCTQSQSCLECLKTWNCYTKYISCPQVVCPSDCDDECYTDYDVASQTLKYFAQITQNGTRQPSKHFFIGSGLKRPHMGFYAPLRYYQQYGYNNNYTNIEIAKHISLPINAPITASNNNSDISKWQDVSEHFYYTNYIDNNGTNYTVRYINTSYHQHLRAGYYASVAFMDNQFGRIIDGLFQYNLWNTTIVSFVGDHGWHLGEQGLWAKETNFEVAVRVPLVIRIPGLSEGLKSDLLVEQIDIFPTLIEASNIGFKNVSNITHQLEGKSLFNIIKNPNYYENYYAYSQYPRPQDKNGNAPEDPKIMGLSMRTSQWRYTEWVGFNPGNTSSAAYPLWDILYGVELYNHSNQTIDENDMNAYDNYNLAYDDDMKLIVEELHNE